MIFAEVLQRLHRQVSSTWQSPPYIGVAKNVTVEREDLAEMLRQFERVEGEYRALYAKEAQIREARNRALHAFANLTEVAKTAPATADSLATEVILRFLRETYNSGVAKALSVLSEATKGQQD